MLVFVVCKLKTATRRYENAFEFTSERYAGWKDKKILLRDLLLASQGA